MTDAPFAVEGEMTASAAVLLGRVTYQEWTSYWPNAEVDKPFKHFINTTPKYVASITLQGVEWENTTLIDGPVGDFVRHLKRQDGQGRRETRTPSAQN